MKNCLLIYSLLLLIPPIFALEYEKDIMPFLAEKCGECHSKTGKAKGGLKLDDPKHFQGRFERNSLVVPGDWDASLLFITLFRPPNHKDAMPPEGKGERLTPKETQLVQQWIADGATINGDTGERGPMPRPGGPGFIEGVTEEPAKDSPPAKPSEQDWTNTEGRTIRATLIRVDGQHAILKMPGGQVHKYPISKLSPESQSRLKP